MSLGSVGAGVEVIQAAPGGQYKRIIFIGQLHRRLVLQRDKPPLAPDKLLGVQNGGAWVLRGGAGPLQAALFQPPVADTAVAGGEQGNLVHNLGGLGKFKAAVSHLPAQMAGNLPVGPGISYRLYRLPHPLHPSLGVGEGAVLLGKAHPGQNHVSQLGRLG
ncbi:hypothetical protein ES708_31952 [subsurface metagenome]